MSENSSALFHTVRLRDALRKDVDKLLKGIRLHKAACLVDGGVEADGDVRGIAEVGHLVLSDADGKDKVHLVPSPGYGGIVFDIPSRHFSVRYSWAAIACLKPPHLKHFE